MEHYLKDDEYKLYEGNAYRQGDTKVKELTIILTNLYLIVEVKQKKMFCKEEITTEKYAIDQIKIYNEQPQILTQNNQVEILFNNNTSAQMTFFGRNERNKFINTIFKLVTGKNSFERSVNKINKSIETVDNALGIDIVDTAKNIAANGLLGGIGKAFIKKKNATNSKSAQAITQIASAVLTPQNTTRQNDNVDYMADRLSKLKKLLDEGAITQAEYDEQKRLIINRC